MALLPWLLAFVPSNNWQHERPSGLAPKMGTFQAWMLIILGHVLLAASSSYLFFCPFSVHLYCICSLHLVYLSLCLSLVVLSVFILDIRCSCVCSLVFVCSLCSWFVPPQLYGLSSNFVLQFPGFLFVTSFFVTCILDFGLQLSRCESLGTSFHARPCNTSHLCTKNQNRQHPLATTHSLTASDWMNATCRLLLWDFKPDQPSDSFGKFLVYFKNIPKLALQNVFQKTCYIGNNPCSNRTCFHFNSTMLSFVIICQECLVMSLKTQQDTTTVCCSASYIHNEWEPWKWRILWTHTFIKKVAFCCPTCLPLCLRLGHLNTDKMI